MYNALRRKVLKMRYLCACMRQMRVCSFGDECVLFTLRTLDGGEEILINVVLPPLTAYWNVSTFTS